MSAPTLTIFQSGMGVVTGDVLNTFEQTCNTFADLRGFPGITGLQINCRGASAVNDGGGGVFYWSASSTGTDNNATIITPNGYASIPGRWLLLTGSSGAISFSRTGTYPPGTVGDHLKRFTVVTDAPFFAKLDGVTDDSAAIQAALNLGGDVLIPYTATGGKISTGLTIGDGTNLIAQDGMRLLAGTNGMTMISSPTHAYYSQINNLMLDGNGYTGVTGFDMTNFRLKAGMFNPSVRNMATGYIFRTGCFGTQILNPDALNVPATLQVLANCSSIQILHPTFDNEPGDGGTGGGIGIDIRYGGGSNIGVEVIGGFTQGYATGIQDAAIGTKVTGTYFEVNGTADISGISARNSNYRTTQHFGPSGPAAIKLRSCDAVVIEWPVMASGARTGLLDADNTNTNCRASVEKSNASYNIPLGTTTGLILSPYTAAFTVADASGASLTLTQNVTAYWSIAGDVVTVTGDITYPTTASGAIAAITLPFSAKSGSSVSGFTTYQTYGANVMLNGGGSAVNFYNIAGAALANSNLSGKRLAFTLTYVTG